MSQMSRQKHLEGDFTPRSPLPSLSDPNRHLKTLTGLRAVAAAWVVLFHASLLFAVLIPPLAKTLPLTGMGFLGVDLFFALSGFVLCHRYLDSLGVAFDRHKVKDFLALRIARLYPVHLFVIVVFVLYIGFVTQFGTSQRWDAKSPWPLLPQHLVLIHAWFNQQLGWNGPAWSVSLEWFAYLCFPFLALLLFRVARSKHFVIYSVLIFVVAYTPLTLDIIGVWNFPPNTFSSSPSNPGLISLSMVRLVGAFTGGCIAFVLARAWQRRVVAGRRPSAVLSGTFCAVLLLVVIVFTRSGESEITQRTWIVSPLLVALVGLVGLGGSFFQWLTRPTLIKLGLSSYSLYMTHWFVFSVFGVLPGIDVGETLADRFEIAQQPLGARVLFCLAALAACYLVAQLCWRFIEEPSRRGLRRRLASSRGELPVEERVDSSAPVTQS
jgi:peptidoglycan/LPS O-acetylase OafA/YrhL